MTHISPLFKFCASRYHRIMDISFRLLVIDDSPHIHEMADLLFSEGQVLHAHNGREGLEKIFACRDLDAVVLDLSMPVLDGFSVLDRLQADHRFPFLPVCVFTANKDEATKALALGARDFVEKNADYQELKLRVLNLIDFKRRSEAAQRAKTDFLSMVSHELRTPMHGILGMAEAMRDAPLSPDQNRYLEILEQSAGKMMTLVEDVLQFLDSENPLHGLPRVAFDPRQVLSAVVARELDAAERTGTHVDTLVAESVPRSLVGLPEKLAVVLHHLTGNAVKFSPGGKVVLSATVVGVSEGAVTVEFAVRDTGIGLPDDWKETIFQPFTQVDGSETRRFGGLGIGLSVASRLVDMLGGTLEVQSESGRGSLFRFSLSFALG